MPVSGYTAPAKPGPLALVSKAASAVREARLVVGAVLASYASVTVVLRLLGVPEHIVEGVGVGLGAAVVVADRITAALKPADILPPS